MDAARISKRKDLQYWQRLSPAASMLLIIILAWHACLLLVGNLFELAGPVAGIAGETGLLSHTLRWDSGWLMNVAENFYRDNPASAAFYPLFPLLVKALHIISFGLIPYVLAGFIINFFASFLAVLGLYKIGFHLLKSHAAALFAASVFLTFPTAFFMHVFYSEALFCALAFWAYYFALRRRWLPMAILLAFLTAARLPSILFICLCFMEYLRAKQWKFTNIDRNALYFLLAPLGFILYGLYLLVLSGNFFGMFSAYSATTDWAYQQFSPNIFTTIARPFKNTLALVLGQAPLSTGAFNYNVMPASGLAVLISASGYALLKIRQWALPLGLFGLLSVILFTLNNNVVSVQRYVLPCLVTYLVAGWLYENYKGSRRQWLLYLLPAVFLIMQTGLFAVFVMGFFVG